MNRRQFTFGALFAGILGFRGFRRQKPCANPEPVGLFQLKFDLSGKCNLDELVKRVSWVDEKNGFRHIRTDVYLSAQDAVFLGNSMNYRTFRRFYGIVTIWIDEETRLDNCKFYRLSVYPNGKSINYHPKNYGLELNSPSLDVLSYDFDPLRAQQNR